MSAHPRCQTCGHQRGPRSTAPMAKLKDGELPRAKKAPCGCECHQARVFDATAFEPLDVPPVVREFDTLIATFDRKVIER